MTVVTFDGDNKLIKVNANVLSVDIKSNVYSYWKQWVQTNSNSKYLQALTAVGGDPISNTTSLGTTYFLENGWRIKPYSWTHRLLLDGNIYTREGVDPVVDPDGNVRVTITNVVSNLVDYIDLNTIAVNNDAVADTVWSANAYAYSNSQTMGNVVVSGNVTATVNNEAVAAAVWNENIGSNTAGYLLNIVAKILRNKTVTDPVTGIMTVYDDDNVSVLFQTNIWENTSETQPYRGQGVESREKLN